MSDCGICGGPLIRHPRGVYRRIISRASYRCERCGDKSDFYRPFFALFQPWSQCPICHNRRLSILARPDQIDRRSFNPFRRLLILVGRPLYHCTFCRFQFRDWRKLSPQATMANDGSQGDSSGSG